MIKVNFNTGTKKNEQIKKITVTSNDPNNPTSTLRVRAFIEVVFDFEQPSLYLGKVKRDQNVTKSAFLLVKDLANTEVLDVISSSEFISARMLDYTDKKGDNKGKYDRMKMEVIAKPGLPLGRINETITVKTNLAEKPTTILRLTGSVIGDVEVTPEWMTFVVNENAAVRPSSLVKKIFISSHLDSSDLKILDLKDPDGNLELQLRPLAEGKKYELTATLKEENIPDRGSISGNVVLTTNVPDQETISIRYSAVRKSYGGREGKGTNFSHPKKPAPPAPGMKDGQAGLVEGDKKEIFVPMKDDPFAPGGDLTEKKDGEKTDEKNDASE